MNTAMNNLIHGDQPSKTLTKRGVFGAENLSLRVMYSYSPFTVVTAVLSKIELEGRAGFQRNLHGEDIRSIKPDDNLVFVLAV